MESKGQGHGNREKQTPPATRFLVLTGEGNDVYPTYPKINFPVSPLQLRVDVSFNHDVPIIGGQAREVKEGFDSSCDKIDMANHQESTTTHDQQTQKQKRLPSSTKGDR